MTKPWREEQAKRSSADEARALAQGKRFRVLWIWDTRECGPLHFSSEAEAAEKTKSMLTEHDKPIPSDFYDRQAVLLQFTVWAEEHVNGQWVSVGGTRHEGVFGVKYLD